MVCHIVERYSFSLFVLFNCSKVRELGTLLQVWVLHMEDLLLSTLRGRSNRHTLNRGRRGGVQIATVPFFNGGGRVGYRWSNIRDVLGHLAVASLRFAASSHGKQSCHGNNHHCFFHSDKFLVVIIKSGFIIFIDRIVWCIANETNTFATIAPAPTACTES